MNKNIAVIEVGPRDGFQNIKEFIPTKRKVEIISMLVDAGVRHIEHTSFVSPKAIPQLRDAAEVTEAVLAKYPDVDFFPLVPNLRGASTAWDLGLKKVAYVVSLSKSHNQANIGRTHEKSLEEFLEIRNRYPDLKVVTDLATTFGCPFEGKMREPERVVNFLAPYVGNGAAEVCLCDTIGIGDPAQTRAILAAVMKAYPGLEVQVHIHDTRNMGMANTLVAIEAGVSGVQSTLGGLGGCPFAPGASGNLSTEDLVFMLHEMGYETGIDSQKIAAAARSEKDMIDGNYSGHIMTIPEEKS